MIETSGKDSGFTLLEILIALVILITGFAAYYVAAGGGLLAGSSSERAWRTANAAENLVASLGRSITLDRSSLGGDLRDGQRWKLHLEPFEANEADGPKPSLRGHIVTLDIIPAEGRGEVLHLQTFLIGPKLP
ncbi:prepilin-type N-terminal cleavage/methylation domain-containing protein [Bradyrhizobium sp. SSUT112]|uniref:prepilin-type N-terminal cleavage/methylation domain-containing protein n=1 Tax=Bradyrhizobium sp. SSUT112 TaxID=3040604 RepID=UPI00244B764F|nr:prepilin-type N-terminal cleavage/methylation domain-containing protein [Bradyrhizobium sp. SSUT112]MDH2352283.1 prepilin-type N-terminal cleavage/methylation domain-containing protein [Bradyrhizobium sp. SSUT112]